MKLATEADGSRDGRLLIVDRALKRAIRAKDIAKTLQEALDQWQKISPLLEARYKALCAGEIAETLDFSALHLMAPLPRAYQFADGSAYVNHVELVRKARGASMPENFWHDPLMYQGGSDMFLGPKDPIPLIDDAMGLDFESEVAVIVNDVKIGASYQEAQSSICLFMILNDVSLRNLIPDELAKGFGFFQSKPSSACAGVAVTPDELLDAWDGARVHLPLHTYLNGHLFGNPNAGKDMTFDFPTLIAHAAKTRALGAGTIIGSGTVSNVDRSSGSSCLAEKRMLEVLLHGKATTPFLKAGDQVQIEMRFASGESIFGSIAQTVSPITVSEPLC